MTLSLALLVCATLLFNLAVAFQQENAHYHALRIPSGTTTYQDYLEPSVMTKVTKHLLHGGASVGFTANTLRETNSSFSFLAYHKTGNFLARDLKQVLYDLEIHPREKKGHVEFDLSSARRCDVSLTACASFETVTLIYAPELSCISVPTCNSIIHFVRDPANWALSFYRYHSQSPVTEEWTNESPDVCKPFEHFQNNKKLGTAGLSILGRAQAQCQMVWSPNHTFHAQLSKLPEMEAVQLSTFFLLFGNDPVHVPGGLRPVGGDMLRMVANAQTLDHAEVPVFNLWMDDMKQRPRVTIRGMTHFLCKHSAAWDCKTITEKVVEGQEKSLKQNANHITSSDSAEETAKLAELNAHPLLGSVYSWVRQKMLRETDRKSVV